jgi:hypothetical protein
MEERRQEGKKEFLDLKLSRPYHLISVEVTKRSLFFFSDVFERGDGLSNAEI